MQSNTDGKAPDSSTGESKSHHAGFLKTDGGKTKSNAIEIPSISLPKGGGAIKGIDEKFSVNAVNGTALFSIPLPFSTARGVTPALALTYNSGNGNGIFGMGWSTGLPSIRRSTQTELPQYIDAKDSDTFLFSEAESLVPVFKKENDGSFSIDKNDNYIINEKDSPDGLYKIRLYQPRIEGLFARIERWSKKTTGIIGWRIISKENITTLFGWSSNSLIADPTDNTKIFEWLPEFVFDDKGNCCRYVYKNEDTIGLDHSLLHNKNRFENGKITYTNRYLEKIIYGNKTPYKKFGDTFPPESDYLFQTIFDYGTLNINDPVEKINDWDFRTDAFSAYKSGFEIRTTRLCKRALLFHHFNELPGGAALVKSINFKYDTTSEQDFTFLKSVTIHGYIKDAAGSYTSKNFPSIDFEYQKHAWNKDVQTISTEDIVHAPSGLDEPQYQFTDLFNEGLSGILTEQAKGWYYKHNLGDGKFERAKLVSPKPSFIGLGEKLQLTDLNADGGKQLVSFDSDPKGYFELADDNEWQPFKTFRNLPTIDFGDTNTRMLDLNGDGKPEILITEDNIFTWYKSAGKEGFSQVYKTIKPFNEETGPSLLFSDQKQTIFLADMSGDGMTDLIRIRNGEICYWPNLGYGRFGSKVGMDNAPLFDNPDSFNPSYLRLADIDGSGTTDLIYLGKNKFTCWLNLSGNKYSAAPFEIAAFPDVHNRAKITVTDLLGNGVACIVWSSHLPKDSKASLKFIDLMKSKKPHLMVSYKNNLGKEVHLTYTASTKFYLADKKDGKPWISKLHFPVHCISETETVDKISGWRFVSSYKYHHGYYDHPEREFRGFGMVEQTDAEHFEHWAKGNASNIADKELHQEPVISKTWFHTGAFLSREKILDQFAHEYWYEEMARQGFPIVHHEVSLPDAIIIPAPGISTTVIDHLTAREWQEALRSCKNMRLRSEIFAHDPAPAGASAAEIKSQLKKQLTPYSVATHNCVIELLQPKGKNKYAIFIIKESESISYGYERTVEDPRIAHNLNIKLDEYGNILESASVVYPRFLPDLSLPAETQQAQHKTVITYSQNQFTNDISGDDVYRLRLPSEVKSFEIKGVVKTGSFYAITDFTNMLSIATTVAYQDIDVNPIAGSTQKRLIEHIRTNYYRNNLGGSLPLHKLESLALPFESYQLAYTPELLTDIYGPINVPGSMINDALLIEGKYTHSEVDNNWWIRSGTIQFIEAAETVTNAQNRFYVPVSYTDPYNSKTKIKYYSNYSLLVEETEDELKNKSRVELFNFRMLSPQRMRDINNNLSESISDELGLVKGMALLGKGAEADDLIGLTAFTATTEIALVNSFFNAPDSIQLTTVGKSLLQHATARFVYDFDVYKNTGKPAVIASVSREEHFTKNPDSPVQLSFEYSNGMGKVVMKKVQAEPGSAKKVDILLPATYTVTTVNTAALFPKQLRWIGNGRATLNNKGNPVKQYEPYFSVTHQYEDLKELVESGVTPIMYYDAIGRLIKTELPDGSFSKVEFDSWQQTVYDANDTVKESEWYKKRTDALRPDFINDTKEQAAAGKAAVHDNTPSILCFDTLGRPILQIENNGKGTGGNDILFKTKIVVDVEGNLRSVRDARELPGNSNLGNSVMQYKYDMLGNLVYQKSMDAGQRWMINNILGHPLRTWDERNHEFQYFYDVLHRPLHNIVIGGDGAPLLNNIFDRIIYGESLLLPGRINEAALQAINILGKPIKHFDTGGVVFTPEYDFKGQPVFSTRKLFKNYKAVANWTDANLTNELENDDFTFISETDALGRITKQIAPDLSIIIPAYNEAGLLNGEKVTHTNPAVTTTYIKDIDYNEKGQRNKIIYGNDVITRFYYDKETFRLRRIETKRQNNDPLQDWYYTYDPVGNITHIEDKNIPVVFFDNQKVSGVSEYTYDALYRLTEATGRENNAALFFDNKDNWKDTPFLHSMNPGDNMSVRNYKQHYKYDEAGNILKIEQSQGNNFTRTYTYENTSNRLKTTQIGFEIYTYTHHTQQGFITGMPHLEEIGWNFKEELIKSIRQKVNPANGTAETTWYQYDGGGQRIRKITENSAATGAALTKKEERIYIAGYEVYKKHSDTHAGLERTTLSLMDQGHRFVMIETRNNINDGTGKHLVRYQLQNHLGSSSMELDISAAVISYEEYHPFGTTAFQAMNATIKTAAKCYRYTGMERDEETGFNYHGARYYATWLGRWISSDPIGIEAGLNSYSYVRNRPINAVDPNGTNDEITDKLNEQYLGMKPSSEPVTIDLTTKTSARLEIERRAKDPGDTLPGPPEEKKPFVPSSASPESRRVGWVFPTHAHSVAPLVSDVPDTGSTALNYGMGVLYSWRNLAAALDSVPMGMISGINNTLNEHGIAPEAIPGDIAPMMLVEGSEYLMARASKSLSSSRLSLKLPLPGIAAEGIGLGYVPTGTARGSTTVETASANLSEELIAGYKAPGEPSAPIFGNPQKTGPGHAETMVDVANDMARIEDASEVYRHSRWTTADKGAGSSRLPDVVMKSNSGGLTAVEVPSTSDLASSKAFAALITRVLKPMRAMGSKSEGLFIVFIPNTRK